MVEILSWFLQQVVIGDWRIFVYNIIQAIIIIALGIIAGKVVKYLLTKLADRAELKNTIKPSFIDLILAVIKWTIYILFVEIAFEQLNVPQLSTLISTILLTIPVIVGALILIAIGFVIASYLKDVIEESQILNWKVLSNLVFCFIIYVFSVFALRITFNSMDTMTVNVIIVILTAVVAVSFAVYILLNFGKKKK